MSSVWGNINDEAYGLPLATPVPLEPNLYSYLLQWNPALRKIEYVKGNNSIIVTEVLNVINPLVVEAETAAAAAVLAAAQAIANSTFTNIGTGAVQRATLDKLKEVAAVSPEDMGAQAIPGFDNKAAFEKVLAATNGILVIPPNRTYYLSGPPALPGSATRLIIQIGTGSKLLLTSSSTNLFEAYALDYVVLDGGEFGNGGFVPATSGGLAVSNLLLARSCKLVVMRNFKAVGLKACRLELCENYKITGFEQDSGLNPNTDPVFSGTYNSNHSLSYGVYIRGSSHGIIDDFHIKAAVTDGVKITRESTGDVYGAFHVISNFDIQDCRNDDAIDLYDSGARVSIGNGSTLRCATGINAKRGDSTAGTDNPNVNTITIHGAIVIDGGSTFGTDGSDGVKGYNINAAQIGCQQGIALNAHHVNTAGIQLINIQGIGINVRDYCKDCTIDVVINGIFTPNLANTDFGNGIFIRAGSQNTRIAATTVITDVIKRPIHAETQDFAIEGASLICDTFACDRFVFVNPSGATPGNKPPRIRRVKMDNRTATAVPFGIRYSASTTLPPKTDDCEAYGVITAPYRDDTAPRLGTGSGNTWQGTGISSDVGNNSKTLAVIDAPVTVYATPITALRGCSEPSLALFEQVGTRRIVQRLASATGIFGIEVRDGAAGTTIATLSAPGTWCETEMTVTGRKLVRSGTLV